MPRRDRQPRSLNALLADIQARPQVYFPALGKGAAGRTAQAATYLNYGPQFDALTALLGSARTARRTGVQSAVRSGRAGAQGITRIRDSYLGGLKDTLGALGGAVPDGAAALSPEARTAQQLGLSGTALSGMLSGMAAQQIQGIGNQRQQLNSQFRQQRGEIGDKVGALFGQAGAYNTQQYESLAGAARKERAAQALAEARLRTQLMTAGINPATGRYDPSLDAPREDTINQYGVSKSQWAAMSPAQRAATAKAWKEQTSTADGNGPGGMTPSQRRARREQYAEVRDNIQSIKTVGNRLASVKVWVNPETGTVVKPDSDGNYPEGATQRRLTEAEIQAAIEKKYPKAPPVVLRAATEMAVDGTMSLRTLRALKRRFPKIEMPRGWVDRRSRAERAQDAINFFG